MKKILIFSHEYPPKLGGAGTVAKIIYDGLNQDYDISVLTSKKSSALSSSSIISTRLPNKSWPFSYSYWLMKNASKYDVIICNDPVAIYNAGLYFSDEILKKTICFIHGEEKYLNSDTRLVGLIKFKKNFIKAICNSKKIIFVSDFIKKFYIEKYNIIDLPSRFTVVHTGVELHNTKSKIIESKVKFLTVSRLERDKGFDVMLSAFSFLNLMGIDFVWEIIGDGSYSDEFKSIVLKSHISDKVKLLGSINREELPKLYRKSNIYISLSELNESYGLSYLEAASCGTFPIGYNRCGTKEAFKYINNGLLIENYKNPQLIASDIFNLIKGPLIKKETKCTRSIEDFILSIKNNIES